MKTILYMILAATFFLAGTVYAQDKEEKVIDDKYVENDVVSLAGKKGISFSTKLGDFLFKPYALVQASATYNRYDSQGLESLYAKSVANSGFAIPNAILGFTGKAFGKVTFNLSLNAAKSGGALLQQAWFDIAIKESFRIRAGKDLRAFPLRCPYTRSPPPAFCPGWPQTLQRLCHRSAPAYGSFFWVP